MLQPRARIWLILGIATVAFANGDPLPDVQTNSLDQERGFVFAGASAQLLVGSFVQDGDFGNYWDPTSDEIAELEKVLTNDLGSHFTKKQRPNNDGPQVHEYFRQYAGVHLNGRRLVFINGFHKSIVEYTVQWLSWPHTESELTSFPKEARNKKFWHFVPVRVDDGGEYYFQAYYDPLSKRLIWFRFHGMHDA